MNPQDEKQQCQKDDNEADAPEGKSSKTASPGRASQTKGGGETMGRWDDGDEKGDHEADGRRSIPGTQMKSDAFFGSANTNRLFLTNRRRSGTWTKTSGLSGSSSTASVR